MRLHALACVLVTCGAASAQTASYSYVNQIPPYMGGMVFNAVTLPRIGTVFRLDVPSSFRTRVCGGDIFVLTGVGNPAVDVPPLGGYLFSSAEVITPVPIDNINRTTTISFPIPNSPMLLGARFTQQALAIGLGTYCSNELSRGGVGIIGT